MPYYSLNQSKLKGLDFDQYFGGKLLRFRSSLTADSSKRRDRAALGVVLAAQLSQHRVELVQVAVFDAQSTALTAVVHADLKAERIGQPLFE